jgi:hypothetical protein
MKKLNLFLILTLFGFGIAAETAYAVDPLNRAPDLAKRTIGAVSATGAAGLPGFNDGVRHNARLAIAPYAQVVPNDSYTFIGITHPSLATAHTSIGLVIEAMDMTFPADHSRNGAVPDTVLRAVAFTINAGETHRVFIVNDGHTTINSEKMGADTKTHLITTHGTENQFGNIRVTSVGTDPNRKTPDANRFEHSINAKSNYTEKFAAHATVPVGVYRYDNLNQLSMWGVVYQESNGAGFSLEFIGDMHDSSAAGTATQGHGRQYEGALCNTALGAAKCTQHPHSAGGILATSKGSGVGRGIN